MYNEIKKIALKYQNKYQCKIDIILDEAYPPVINDIFLFDKVKYLIKDLVILEKPFMQAEDFGYYCNIIPSVFFLLGVGGDIPLHNEGFYFNNDLLQIGLDNFIKLLDI